MPTTVIRTSPQTCLDHAFCSGYTDAKEGLGFPNRIYLERRYPMASSRAAYEEGFNEFINNHQVF
jgi:hypothetical protein